MFAIHVTETRKDHTGKPHAGFVIIEDEPAKFLDEDHAVAFIEAPENAEFFAEFAAVEVVPAP